jgi:hypothetical protein
MEKKYNNNNNNNSYDNMKLNESNLTDQSYIITSHNFSNNIKFINENEILFLWICHPNNNEINNNNIKELIENYFDLNNYGYISKEDLNKNDDEFIFFLEKLFN